MRKSGELTEERAEVVSPEFLASMKEELVELLDILSNEP
jgi:hypothetical protein